MFGLVLKTRAARTTAVTYKAMLLTVLAFAQTHDLEAAVEGDKLGRGLCALGHENCCRLILVGEHAPISIEGDNGWFWTSRELQLDHETAAAEVVDVFSGYRIRKVVYVKAGWDIQEHLRVHSTSRGH
jgi:hypothetical protein